jgi:hypothetical protein
VKFRKQNGTRLQLRELLRKLTLRQERWYSLEYAREFLHWISRGRSRERATRAVPATVYHPPRLTRLTPEQAKLKLLGHLSVGDPGAKDLLDLLFPEPIGTATHRQSGQTSDSPSSLRRGE